MQVCVFVCLPFLLNSMDKIPPNCSGKFYRAVGSAVVGWTIGPRQPVEPGLFADRRLHGGGGSVPNPNLKNDRALKIAKLSICRVYSVGAGASRAQNQTPPTSRPSFKRSPTHNISGDRWRLPLPSLAQAVSAGGVHLGEKQVPVSFAVHIRQRDVRLAQVRVEGVATSSGLMARRPSN